MEIKAEKGTVIQHKTSPLSTKSPLVSLKPINPITAASKSNKKSWLEPELSYQHIKILMRLPWSMKLDLMLLLSIKKHHIVKNLRTINNFVTALSEF